MTTLETSFQSTPYIAAGTRQTHLQALYNDLKADGEASWKKFNSFYDIDDSHIGKLLHILHDKTALSECRQSIEKIKNIIKVVAIVFAGLACLALITIGALAFAALIHIPLVLAPVALAIGVIGLSMLIVVAVIEYRKYQKIQNSHLTKLLKESPIDPESDKDFTDLCQMSNDFLFDLNQELAASEYLAHEAAYKNLKIGQIIPIREKTHHVTYATVSHSINKEGFVCFLLTPLQEKHYLKKFPIWELFRGTHDKKSAKRLPESCSAGHESYKLYEQELIDAKATIVPIAAQSIIERKYGHSLGGADAQRSVSTTAVKIVELMGPKTYYFSGRTLLERVTVSQEVSTYLKKVRSIEVYAWNSAGIANETNDNLKAAITKINQAKNSGGSVGCNFSISTCKVGGDGIQRTGQITLGHGIPAGTATVTREAYKFDHGFEGYCGFYTLQAHQTKNFNRGKVPKYTYISAITNHAAIEADNSDHIKVGEAFWEPIKLYFSSLLIGKSPGL